MTYRGHIKDGVAVLDEGVNLPDGTPVRVEVDDAEGDFWTHKSIEQIAREQDVKPCTDPRDLAIHWPQHESVDDFIARIRQSRV